jgi:hypothetical protein
MKMIMMGLAAASVTAVLGLGAGSASASPLMAGPALAAEGRPLVVPAQWWDDDDDDRRYRRRARRDRDDRFERRFDRRDDRRPRRDFYGYDPRPSRPPVYRGPPSVVIGPGAPASCYIDRAGRKVCRPR